MPKNSNRFVQFLARGLSVTVWLFKMSGSIDKPLLPNYDLGCKPHCRIGILDRSGALFSPKPHQTFIAAAEIRYTGDKV